MASARVSLAREGNQAVLRVEDDGPGIPEGEIARMMEPFTRLEASRNTATGGTGLGLTLARAIADQHGGSLVLANRVEAGRIAGLVATLRLPVRDRTIPARDGRAGMGLCQAAKMLTHHSLEMLKRTAEMRCVMLTAFRLT
jgi:K+-sensing histidine kinase KdpD